MSSNVNIPESFLCPITHNIMSNPHIDNDGNTYEYNAILQWLENNNTSPITRNYLHYSHLKPNRSLLELIINFNSNNNNISSISNNINNISNNNSSDISTENNFTVEDYAIKLSIDKYRSFCHNAKLRHQKLFDNKVVKKQLLSLFNNENIG